jgi:signal peptidase II
MRLPPMDNFRSPAAIGRFALTTGIGVALDLLTKVWAVRELVSSWRTVPDGRIEVETGVYPFIPGWLHFQVTFNRGAVFGLGQGQRWLFLSVSVVALGFLTWLFAASDKRQRFYQVMLGMLLAGVLGNMYDRIVFGYVRDMIHALPRWPSLFPYIFNVADSLLCTGVFLMIVYSFFHHPQTQRTTDSTDFTDSRLESKSV